ncbi:MAG TPA: hypothetical protein VMG10_16085 [Gemmataceae bacterium]|nr:hypothetical protein [Gemmataceae bacterium]
MHLKRIGYYFQLPEADRLHILKLLARKEPIQDEGAVAEYLDSGVLIAAVPGVEDDPLLPDAPIAGALHVLTDGEYAWPKTLSYWVRQHHLLLPDEFLEHVRHAAYRVPKRLDPAALVLV